MFNYFITINLKNYDSLGYKMTDKDNIKIEKWLESHKHIKEYLLGNEKINSNSQHIHCLILHEKCKEYNKKNSYYKNQLRKSLKYHFRDYNINKDNKIWLNIKYIKNKNNFLSGYMQKDDDSKIIKNNSKMTFEQLLKEKDLYIKTLNNKKLSKFQTWNKNTSWSKIHKYIFDNNIKIVKYEDIQHLELSLFYSGIVFNFCSNDLFNKIYLYYTKDKELEFNLISSRQYLTKEEIKEQNNEDWYNQNL